jgi:AraC family transcriptional regulator
MAHPVVRDSTVRTHYESVERVIAAMRNHLDEPLTLRQLARIGYASPYHFIRNFRRITGIPPAQFLRALRLDAAKRMLTETQKKVIDICYEVGYTSVGTFTRRFVDVLGMSPVRLRRLAGSRSIPLPGVQLSGSTKQQARMGAALTGYIEAPDDFQGVIAVGLFTTRMPQGKPVGCALLRRGGMYQLESAPEGDFYLFAVGLKEPAGASVYFDYRAALRAGGHPIRISGGVIHGPTSLVLRPPSPFDPPLLLVLPAQLTLPT